MKYNVVKRNGKPIFAGFSTPPPLEPGDALEAYDDAQPGIVAEILANRPKRMGYAELLEKLKAKGVI